MLGNYGPGGAIDPDTFTSVQYHVGDSYSTSWGNARYGFYSITGTPTVYFDGITSVIGAGSTSSAYTNYRNTYLARLAVSTDVTIELFGDQVSGQTYEITCTACIEPGGSTKTMRIYITQVLDDWPAASTHYPHNTFKQAAATEDITLTPGGCENIFRTFTFDTASWNNQSDIKIIAWAQVPNASGPAQVHQTAVMLWPFPPSGARGDDCDRAVFCGNSSYSGFTSMATNDGSATCGDSSASPDLWYSYRAPESGTLRVDTCGSTYDTVVSIHTECPGTGVELDCNDDADTCGVGSAQSQALAAVTVGETYLIRLAGHSGATGDYTLNVDGPVDVTAPTPDPMSFSSPPMSVPMGIAMIATEATDLGSPPVEYQFELSTSGGGGGDSSGWQLSNEHSDEGLDPDSSYMYKVRARDAALNETAYSSPATAYTPANVPGAPVLGNISVSRMDADVDAAGNPAHTVFALYCAGAFPDDAIWEYKWVDASGDPSDTEVWLTAAEWGTMTIWGLTGNTNYCWRAKAKNQAGVQTGLGDFSCKKTTVMPLIAGDLDDNGAVDLDDYAMFDACLAGPDVTVAPPLCGADAWEYADVNPNDGDVDLEDYAAMAESFSGS